jgi:GTP-binding protein HflX
LLFVVDAADPSWEGQLAVAREVIRDIGAENTPSRVVMNKIDRLTVDERAVLERANPEAWFISAHDAGDVARVREAIVAFFERSFVTVEIVIPYKNQSLLSELYESCRVEKEAYEEDGVHVRFRGDPAFVTGFREKLST